jgi:glycosyltransferase involved in cell wall biosynthesis
MRACWSTGTPLFVRGDSQLGPDGPSLRAWARLITHRRFVPRFAACLAVGTRSDSYFRFYGARRVVRSPHFVDNDRFERGAAAADVGAVRHEWAVPDGHTIAAFVGKLVPKKRPLDLIGAVAASGRRDIHVVFIGDGELREACRTTAERLGVPATFAGFHNQSELPAAYAAMDILVLPSDVRETWGLVVNEAMACGTPVLVSDAAGCAPDLVRAGETGYAYPVGAVATLGAHLTTIASSPELLRRLGDAARSHVARYTAEAAAAGVLEAVALAAWERAA